MLLVFLIIGRLWIGHWTWGQYAGGWSQMHMIVAEVWRMKKLQTMFDEYLPMR